jgi:hypothetical protein
MNNKEERRRLGTSKDPQDWLLAMNIELSSHEWTNGWKGLVQMDVFNEGHHHEDWTNLVAGTILMEPGARERLLSLASLDVRAHERKEPTVCAEEEYARRLRGWLIAIGRVDQGTPVSRISP